MISIWKDIEIDLTSELTDGRVDYRINADGTQIFRGRAYADAEGNCVVTINRIIADALFRNFAYFGQTGYMTTNFADQPNIAPTIKVLAGGTQKFNDTVAMDWSYDYAFALPNDAPAAPITGRIDMRMPLAATTYKGGNIVAHYISPEGTDTTHTFATGSGHKADLWIAPKNLHDSARISLQGFDYPIVETCARFALYYVNAFGGLDCLLMEGSYNEGDDLTRHTFDARVSNAKRSNRGRTEYAAEIRKRYTLRTGWLTDAQAARMWHLVESNQVYLYDLAGLTAGAEITPSERFAPVIIKDTTCEWQTFKTNGRRMAQYVLNVELSQPRYRETH